MSLPMCMRRKLTFAVTFAFFFCVIFVFAAEVRANGNPYADAPPVEPSPNRSVRRAPIRRPPQRAPVRTQNQRRIEPPQPPQPTSLEIGIRMMEQMRYNQARTWLQKAVQEERGNPYAWYWYGKAHDRIGQFQQAQVFYRRALELDPGFPPFLRVVTYPDDGGRRALWDPLRPARIYPIELGNRGVAIVPPGAPEAGRRPATRPTIDPSLPSAPIYAPPSPRGGPSHVVHVPPQFQGQPAVYALPQQVTAAPAHVPQMVVAPSGGHAPIYVPPAPPAGTAQQPVYVPPSPPADAVQQPVYIPPPPPR